MYCAPLDVVLVLAVVVVVVVDNDVGKSYRHRCIKVCTVTLSLYIFTSPLNISFPTHKLNRGIFFLHTNLPFKPLGKYEYRNEATHRSLLRRTEKKTGVGFGLSGICS